MRAEIERLRSELTATNEYLQAALAQHGATNEELAVANEELLSVNEEMQSANEELQTAKEELQSSNEELETLNEELQRGHDHLQVLNDDLVNILAAVNIAIIIVDTARCIRRFTPTANSVMKLLPGDIGRPIADLQPIPQVTDFDRCIEHVIETLQVVEQEVSDAAGNTFRMQVRPYRAADARISGAVISFVDVTTLHDSLRQSREARDYVVGIIETIPNPLVVLDGKGGVVSANPAFRALFEDAGPGRPWRLAQGGEIARFLDGSDGKPLTYQHTLPDGSARVFLVGANKLLSQGSHHMLVALLDITDRVYAERERGQLREQAARERDAFLDGISHELKTPLNAIVLWAELLARGGVDAGTQTRGAELVLRSAREQARSIDDLLAVALSRSQDAMLSVVLQDIDPASVVRDALDALRDELDGKDIVLAVALVDDARVKADPRRLRQIAWHLISNAVKCVSRGGHVNVTLAISGDDLELAVKPSKLDVPELSLVRHLVEGHGGTLVEPAASDHLASFRVRLPHKFLQA